MHTLLWFNQLFLAVMPTAAALEGAEMFSSART